MVAPYGSATPNLAGGIASGTALPNLIQPQGFSGSFADSTAGIRSIAENYAAAFSKDPARRQQYQQQLAMEDAQKQQQLQQLREQQLHFMDQMTQLAMNGGLTPGVQKMTQQAGQSIDALFGPGTAQQWQSILASADASFKAQPQNIDLVEAIDPKTGQKTWVPKAQAAGMQASTDVLSPEALAQKEQLAAAGRTQVNVDARPVSQEQTKALGYADRMAKANETIEGLNYQPTMVGNALSNVPVVGNMLTSTQKQQYDQAKRDFMTANLRKESGAVISEEEFNSQDQTYFPQPGDSEKVIQQKAEARKQVILNSYREGRPVTGEEAKAAAEPKKPKTLKYDPATDSLTPVE